MYSVGSFFSFLRASEGMERTKTWRWPRAALAEARHSRWQKDDAIK